ncbi:hypothetical protein LIA77_08794 [Sarocladium implicatum]|nr:hypothetical protein LIA77_08794 [Sarocladium implicatum]
MKQSILLLPLAGMALALPKGYDDCSESTITITSTGTPPAETCLLCVDLINSCGQTYGGCYNECETPSPSFIEPPCPTLTPITTAPGSDCTICVDKVNSCGMTYGGCYDECKTPSPTFTEPPCPTSTPETSVTPTPTCSLTVCIDGVTPCGQGFGGCFPACDGIPSDLITTPYCSLTATPTPPSTSYYNYY